MVRCEQDHRKGLFPSHGELDAKHCIIWYNEEGRPTWGAAGVSTMFSCPRVDDRKGAEALWNLMTLTLPTFCKI